MTKKTNRAKTKTSKTKNEKLSRGRGKTTKHEKKYTRCRDRARVKYHWPHCVGGTLPSRETEDRVTVNVTVILSPCFRCVKHNRQSRHLIDWLRLAVEVAAKLPWELLPFLLDWFSSMS
jgi:hypothetical protein